MRSAELLKIFAEDGILAGVQGNFLPDIPLAGVSADSRKIIPGMIFCAIKGSRADGNLFTDQAVAAGAAAIITAGKLLKSPVPVVYVSNDYRAFALLVRYFCGCPDNNLHLTAVTGTNGKTTTVYALKALEKVPEESGMMTTVTINCGKSFQKATHTTPDAETFFSVLQQMRDCGCRRVYFEASSHALSQSRMGNVKLKNAVFTNLTQDHLDYHGTMENYFLCKKKLFTDFLADNGKAVINSGDPFGKRLKEELLEEYPGRFQIHDFGSAGAAHELQLMPGGEGRGVSFTLDGKTFHSNMSGEFNAYNLAGAILASPFDDIPQEITVNVPGRMEAMKREDGAKVFIDFAHTDDALRRVLNELQKLTSGKLIVVFGAGGDRDKGKRPAMGRAVAEFADVAIVTSDNPRGEVPEDIIADILAGMQNSVCDIKTCVNRREAIRIACQKAGSDDIVLIAGKGHENTQEYNGEITHFSDQEEAAANGFTLC